MAMPDRDALGKMTAMQCRAARAMLDWSRRDLSEHGKVAQATIADFETLRRIPYERTIIDLQRAFENQGVCFISMEGDIQRGVVLGIKDIES